MKTIIFYFRHVAVPVLLLTFFLGQNLLAQNTPPTIYFEITKLKKTNDDLMSVEEEIVKPFVQERIKQGNQLLHAMFEVHYPDADDAAYDYVILDVFNDFNHLNLGREKLGEMVYAVFPNADIPRMIERYEASAKKASSEVFVIRDEAFPGPAGANDEPPKFVRVNHMKVSETNSSQYVAMESEIFKPMHLANAKAGNLYDWLLLQRIMPYGTEWDNNYLTFDIFTEWSDMVAGNDGLFAKVHPGKDANATWEKMVKLRELRRSEIWELISFVDPSPPAVTYEMVKEGAGANPMKGQEVAFKGTLMNLKGEKLFSSADLGYDFYATLGANIYDRFFDKGLQMMKKGGILSINIPAGAQDKGMKQMTGNEVAVLKIELLDIGKPKPNGAEWLEKTIEAQGLSAAREQYQKLQSNNPEGYVFREGDMNGLGYRLMGKGQHSAAIYVFELNTKNYPKSWNACDSLGDGYQAAGDYAKAKHCYEMALKNNPDFQASKDKLKKM